MKKAAKATPNHPLRRERMQRNWSLKDVAERIGGDTKTVGRWERGITVPSPHFRQKLCELFGKSARELSFIADDAQISTEQGTHQSTFVQEAVPPVPEMPLPDASALPVPTFWNVPYRRNPFFTGREDILNRLYTLFHAGKTGALTHPQALCGLGGIGKSQTAAEYAYRHYHDYLAVLWVRADSHEMLVSDFAAIADLLNLPERNEQNQSRVVEAVKQWLKDHAHWLLILDNVNDLQIVQDFIPPLGRGHILLTCRAQATGTIAQRIEMEKMKPEEGALLLLRRAKLIEADAPLDDTSYQDWARAKTIAEVMDGLPLALDQAGAYIEEMVRSLSEYLDLYQTHYTDLLKLRGTLASDHSDHPEPVATTWSLSFEKVVQANPAAADLLRLCAFLHPDAIPEEIFTEGGGELGPTLQSIATDSFKLTSAIQELRKFSLVRRNPDAHTLTLHRLVQAVLKDGMDTHTQRMWAERAIRAVNRTFPGGEFATWNLCQRCLSHVQACATLVKQWDMQFQEAAQLLNRAGNYLRERVQYSEAELLLKQALTIREQILGPEHIDVADLLNDLATVYDNQGNYVQAESLYQQAVAICEETLEPEHAKLASSLNNLALLYQEEGKYTQAESLFQRVLAIHEKTLGPEHSETAIALNNLAIVYQKQGKYTQSEVLNLRSLAIREKIFGPEHLNVATSLNNLGLVYEKQGKYTQAEMSFQQALAILEKTVGREHPNTASSLSNLADVYRLLGKYTQAEELHLQALAIREKVLGPEHPHVAYTLNKLAHLYAYQSNYNQAEPLYQRALRIRTKALGSQHPEVAQTLNALAEIYHALDQHTQAELFYQQALAIWEQTLGLNHPEVIAVLEKHQKWAELQRNT